MDKNDHELILRDQIAEGEQSNFNEFGHQNDEEHSSRGGGKARTMDFHAGDIGYVPRTFGHYIENTRTTDLVFLDIFKANKYDDFSLSQWMRRTPPKLVMDHLKISAETLASIPEQNNHLVPAKS